MIASQRRFGKSPGGTFVTSSFIFEPSHLPLHGVGELFGGGELAFEFGREFGLALLFRHADGVGFRLEGKLLRARPRR